MDEVKRSMEGRSEYRLRQRLRRACTTGASCAVTIGATRGTLTEATAGTSTGALPIVHFIGHGGAAEEAPWWQHGMAQRLIADTTGATSAATKRSIAEVMRMRRRRASRRPAMYEEAAIPAGCGCVTRTYDERHIYSNASSAAATSSFDGRSR